MKIEVSLWLGENEKFFQELQDEKSAEVVIDQLITDVQHGKYGPGRFRLEADRKNPGFSGSLWRTKDLCSLKKCQSASD